MLKKEEPADHFKKYADHVHEAFNGKKFIVRYEEGQPDCQCAGPMWMEKWTGVNYHDLKSRLRYRSSHFPGWLPDHPAPH